MGSLEKGWFWTQLVLGAFSTTFQLFLWLWSAKAGLFFVINNCTLPTTGMAGADDSKRELLKILATKEGVDFSDLDAAQMQEALDDFEAEHCSGGGDLEDEWAGMCKDFKGSLKELSKINGLQNTCTNMRSFIGALSTIIEPSLSAMSAFASSAKASGDAAKLASRMLGEAAVQASLKASAVEKCLASRSASTAAGGLVAAVGLKQAAMKTAYTKLVVLNNTYQDEMARVKKQGGKPRISEVTVEMEIENIFGDQASKLLSLASGKSVPEE
eukprot:gnl/TRDRNA2_/TRDRNA2_143655_c1_seq1.p1 gnl/TRDRNA2_/TRDRNA2_143655_c1~~gnl/TRDRNA2_/TRDRNA2_143655_c1_seq1.p1  ORF type:complete len:302 (-),score=70.13 gnl/TRDRNA2_/TRDRNA2_143655_c1_seq1:38-850(-)